MTGPLHQACEGLTTNDEQELPAKTVNRPSSIQGEENAKRGVQSIDQGDLVRGLEHLLVDLRRICIQCALSGDLLSSIEYEREQETFAHGSILPESGVVARDGFLLVFEGFSNHEQLVLNFLLGVAYFSECSTSGINVVALLQIPSGRTWDGADHAEDCDRHHQLKHHHDSPVPFAQRGLVLGAGVVDPEADE